VKTTLMNEDDLQAILDKHIGDDETVVIHEETLIKFTHIINDVIELCQERYELYTDYDDEDIQLQ
jgi:hypothetical protein